MTPEHDSLTARDHLLAIARLWPELVDRLAGGGSEKSEIRTAPGSRPPISAHISDVISEVTTWANFLARVLVEEARKPAWTPPADLSVPSLLDSIARQRIGHFTEHPDEMLRLAFFDEALAHREMVERTARPSGVRTIRLDVACIEDGCAGRYTMRMHPDRPETLTDMVCSKRREHTIDPDEWRAGISRSRGDLTKVRAAVIRARRHAEQRDLTTAV